MTIGPKLRVALIAALAVACGNLDEVDEEAGSHTAELGASNITSISASSTYDTHRADYAIDRDFATRWTARGKGVTITGDLGADKWVNAVRISWYRGSARKYRFEVGAISNGSYRRVFSGYSFGTARMERYAFGAVKARKVRVTVFGNTENDYASIYELEAVLAPDAAADTTSPSIAAPPDVTASATGAITQIELGTPTVRDNVDPAPVVTNDAPAAGFPVGTTVVTWRATDRSGNSATATQRVTINPPLSADTLPPTITAPADITASTAGALTQVALGTPTVRDNVDPAPVVTNDAPAAGFPVGTTVVTWRATDRSGNSATATQRVTINPSVSADTLPPTITAPADVTASAAGALTQIELGTPTVRDNVDPAPVVTNDAPAAGFPVGTTVVTWRATDRSGNSATAAQRVTINPPSSPAAADVFGTKAIYPSAAGGQTWSSKWSSNPRTLSAGQVDPQDSMFWMRGSNHTLQILGDGTAKSSGDTIRFYVGDRAKTRKWQNVEFTMYSMRVSEQSDMTSTAGFAVETRTDDGHTSSTNLLNSEGLDRRCEGHAYAYALRYDGRALLQKELKHPTYTSQLSKNVWSGGTMPRSQWIGMKVITRNVANGVKLEIWRDLTDGANGGTWEKIQEYTDSGGWSISASVASTCRIAPDHIITTAEPFIIVRNDNVQEQRYKKVSIREIAP